MNENQINKIHRKKLSGSKIKKNQGKNDKSEKKINSKAFAIQSVNKAARIFRRGKDIETKKQHVPYIEKSEVLGPPFIVSIIGPPLSGKSTLLRCLVKSFLRQNIVDIKGPITIVTGKRKRITFIECNNDINCMIDLAKISDLALLLIDASFGFEMEIFEFINICQVHGFPRIMGVLTHLDHFKQINTLRKTKKRLKHRFWTEIYQGAKLFYLSGLKKDDYLKVEIHNLGRFISVLKPQNIEWRNNHPYVLVDRYEDMTPKHVVQANPKCDRNLTFYGYVHGSHLKYHSDVHIIGVGDYSVDTISYLDDPCPLPYKIEYESNTNSNGNGTKEPKTIIRRSLNNKERVVYAPMSGLGGLIYDKDAIYIDLAGSHSHKQNNLGENEKVIEELDPLKTIKPLDAHLNDMTVSLFKESQPLRSEEINRDFFHPQTTLEDGNTFHAFDAKNKQLPQMDIEGEDYVDQNLKKAEDFFPLQNVVIESEKAADDSKATKLEDDLVGGLFTLGPKGSSTRKSFVKDRNSNLIDPLAFYFDPEGLDDYDCSALGYRDLDGFMKQVDIEELINKNFVKSGPASHPIFTSIIDWNISQHKKLLRNRIMKISATTSDPSGTGRDIDKSNLLNNIWQDGTEHGNLNSEDTSDKERNEENENNSDSESGNAESDDESQEETESQDESNNSNKDLKLETKDNETDETVKPLSKKEKRLQEIKDKKAKQKARFDNLYDTDKKSFYNEMKQNLSQQSQLNKSVFEDMDEQIRVKYEGFRAGMYVRMEIQGIPPEFVDNFDPTYPLIIGGVLPNECSHGYLQARVKKHRWFEKILKTRDPLILSVGWRRYQSVLVYSNEDHSGKNRMLKYTPQNGHCLANFYGPICPQNSGILGIQNLSEGNKNFRISMTGVIVNLDKSLDIVKKLKLVGEPIKIFKKTAFVNGLFNSDLEAVKFEGATVKTVSSIRGQIKKALASPPGAVRVTFEDQIQMSDIVFLNAWTKVDVAKLYNPVCNLLLPPTIKRSWVGMKTVGQLRYERGLKAEYKNDSIYKDVQRVPNVERSLYIPQNLEKILPFVERLKLLKQVTNDKISNSNPMKTKASEAGADKLNIVLRSSFKTDSSLKYLAEDDPYTISKNGKRKSNQKGLNIGKAFKKIAIIEDENDIKINRLMKVAQFMHGQKVDKKRKAMVERVDRHRKELAKIQAKQEANQKSIKKRVCRALGMIKAKRDKTLNLNPKS